VLSIHETGLEHWVGVLVKVLVTVAVGVGLDGLGEIGVLAGQQAKGKIENIPDANRRQAINIFFIRLLPKNKYPTRQEN
jgi:hypothetical protein